MLKNKGYIYKITNKTNKKCYIGQTSIFYEKRWKAHINASKNENDEAYNYPLQKAFRKYGAENFIFEILEECEIVNLSNREIYWINFFDSYNKGYNQTLGGEGSKKYSLNELEVIEKYFELKNLMKTANFYGCRTGIISNILKKNNIEIIPSKIVVQEIVNNVYQYDKEGNYLRAFTSQSEAGKWILENYKIKGKTPSRNIKAAIDSNGMAYGYYWRYEKKNKIEVNYEEKKYFVFDLLINKFIYKHRDLKEIAIYTKKYLKLNTKETTIYNSLVKKKPIFYYNLLILEEQLTLEEIEEIKKSKKKLLNKQKKENKKKKKINSNEKQTHIFLLINNSEDKFAIIDLHSKYESLDVVISKKSFKDRFIKIFQDIFKYGLNKFTFKFLKTISVKELKSTKEELINIYKKTYKNTYNVKSRKEYKRNFDINEIIQYYNSSDNITLQKLSNKFSLSTKFLSKLLKENNVEIKKVKNNKPIYQLDAINLEIIQCFESLSKAIKENEEWKSTTIHDVLKGKNKTAYGFKWCYVEDYKIIKQ